jgi:protein subunit release factor A
LKELVKDEIGQLRDYRTAQEEKLKILLIPKDPVKHKVCIPFSRATIAGKKLPSIILIDRSSLLSSSPPASLYQSLM